MLRRFFLADQLCLSLVLVLGAGLAFLGPDGRWRLLIGAWFTLFVGVKVAIFVRALWRWLESDQVPLARASVGIFLGAFLPYLLLGAHVTTAMSSTSDEPYYLLVAHSLLYDHDLNLANNVVGRDYLPFYWGDLPRVPQAIQRTPDGGMYSRLYQGFQPVLLMPGYAAAGPPGRGGHAQSARGRRACCSRSGSRAASGASLRAAFLAWLGAAFSLPLVTFAVSPFPEISGAFFAAAAAYALWQSPRDLDGRRHRGPMPRGDGGGQDPAVLDAAAAPAGLPASAHVADPGRGLCRRLVAATVAATTTTTQVFLQRAHPVADPRAGASSRQSSGSSTWTTRAPTEYRGHLGLLLDQEFGLLATAPSLRARRGRHRRRGRAASLAPAPP